MTASTFSSLHDFFHSTGFLIARDAAVSLAVVFWLSLAYWVNKDARRRIDDPVLVLIATLLGLVPYIGPLVYLLFRPSESLDDARSRFVELQALEQQLARELPKCPVCSSAVEPNYLACPVCATELRKKCTHCDAPIEPLWQVCPYCTSPIEPSRAELDAALTAEVQRITGIDNGGELVPQPQPSAADA